MDKEQIKNKRIYKKKKDHSTDMTYENEMNTFLEDIANNTPNDKQFDEEEFNGA